MIRRPLGYGWGPMAKPVLAAVLAAAVWLALAGGAGARAQAPGVTPDEILIGGTAPLSGDAAAAAAVAKGAQAYFRYVNARGGVYGRTIRYVVLDDAGDPAQTVQAVQQLVQEDGVFAIFGAVGADENLAVRPALNEAGVPQLFGDAGATALGAAGYPWTIGYPPADRAEGSVYGRYLAASLPSARVGVLYQADASGKELLAGLRRGLGARASQVSAQGYDPASTDVQAQVAALKASGATVLCDFAFGDLAAQALADAARLGWRPQVVVADASAPALRRAPTAQAKGAISIAYLKDPAAPAWAGDPGVLLFRQVLRRYGAGTPARDGYAIAGMASAFTLVDALTRAGRNPTRAGLMRAATSLDEANDPFLLPGIVLRTTRSYRYPVSQVQLRRWTGAGWQLFGGLVEARP